MITKPYRILVHAYSGREALLCLQCNRVSWNPNDVKHRYCGACHVFLDDLPADIPGPEVRAQVPTFLIQGEEA